MEGEEANGVFETAVKQRQEVNGGSRDNFMTPSPYRLNLYRPSTLKLMQMQQHNLQEDKKAQISLTCVIVARIDSIRNENNRYWFQLSDCTSQGSSLQVYFPKTNQSTLSNFTKHSSESEIIEQIQFESNQQEGQPYFRVWMRQQQREGIENAWLVEKVERIRDGNEVSHHWSCAMWQTARVH